MQPSILLSTAYLPPVQYFQKINQAGSISIEKYEHYIKQSYRNRCYVFGANGVLPLSIPVIHTHEKELVSETKISYAEKWQQQHWRTIESAYRNSPYFIYYEDGLKPFYEKKYDLLFDYNLELIQFLLRSFKIEAIINLTEKFDTSDSSEDYRYSIHPKKNTEESFKPYSQLFSDKYGFRANLSAIDLLFNTGPYGKEHL